MLPIIIAICAFDLRPIDLGAMTLDRARTLDGKPATVSFVVAKPSYTFLGRTMVGPADRDDDVERGAVLLGKRLDVKEGERLVVRGVLRVIQHKGDVVNGVIVPAWFEVRVTEVRP
ncbi:MAG: hypothetical protein K8U57_20505 [Planctomycetes bacterium]|nr:hypothetical protein [Planctomycetota bacterium]